MTSTVAFPSPMLSESIYVKIISNGLASSRLVHLRVSEMRMQNPEAVRVEISHADDYRFIYAEGITRELFTSIREKSGLSIDFEDFGKCIVQLIRKRETSSTPLRIECVIDERKDTCCLELVSQLEFQITKISIVLRRVVGEELNNHLIDLLNRAKKDSERLLQQSLKEVRLEAEQHANELEGEIQQLKRKIDELQQTITQMGVDCTLEAEEKNAANLALDDIRKDLNEADEEIVKLNNDQKILLEEIEELRIELQEITNALEKEKQLREDAEIRAERERTHAIELDRDRQRARRTLQKTLKAVEEEELMPGQIEQLKKELAEKDCVIQQLQAENQRQQLGFTNLSKELASLRIENEKHRHRDEYSRKLYEASVMNRYASPVLNLRDGTANNPTIASPCSFAANPRTANQGFTLPLRTLETKMPHPNIFAAGKNFAADTPLRNSPQLQILGAMRPNEAKENVLPSTQSKPTTSVMRTINKN